MYDSEDESPPEELSISDEIYSGASPIPENE